jgi:hypothetical protein
VTKYLTLNQWPIFLVLRCTTLIRSVAVTYRQNGADPILGTADPSTRGGERDRGGSR